MQLGNFCVHGTKYFSIHYIFFFSQLLLYKILEHSDMPCNFARPELS